MKRISTKKFNFFTIISKILIFLFQNGLIFKKAQLNFVDLAGSEKLGYANMQEYKNFKP